MNAKMAEAWKNRTAQKKSTIAYMVDVVGNGTAFSLCFVVHLLA